MTAKKKSATKTAKKTAKKKPTARKKAVPARAKRPKKPKAAPALEVKKPVEVAPEVKPIEVRPELEPIIEAKAVEVKEQVVEAKPEAKISTVEVKPAVKPEVEKPVIEAKAVQVKEQVVEAKPEAKIPTVEVQPEAARPVEFKPIKPEVEEVIEVKRGVEVKPPVLRPKLLKVKPALKPQVKRPVMVRKPLVAPPTERVTLVIRLRGEFGVPEHIERTLTSLGLKRKYNATLVQNAASMTGMLRHVKDYVTWGDINSVDIARLLRERGELRSGLSVSDKFAKDAFSKQSIDELAKAISSGQTSLRSLWEKGVKPVFRLHPPSGGFDTTAKRPYGSHGQLGYRGAAITRLMTQMT